MVKKGKKPGMSGMMKDNKGAAFVKKGGVRASASALPSMPKMKGVKGMKKPSC